MKGAHTFLILFLTILGRGTIAQVVVSNNPGQVVNPDAMVSVEGIEGGVLFPRMTEAQRLAIISPTEGLTVYQSNMKSGYYVFNGNTWFYHSALRKEHGTIKVDMAASSPFVIGTLGTGYSVIQIGGPPSNEFRVEFDVPFDDTPNITISSEPFPPPVSPIIGDYCTSTHANLCDDLFSEDYLDDVILESFNSGVFDPTGSIIDLSSNCNLGPGNYSDNTTTPALIGTLYGQCGPGGASNTYNIGLRSSWEWPDDVIAYIDWNQDADFYDSNEVIYYQQFDFTSPAFDLLTMLNNQVVPADAANGITHMRCQSIYSPLNHDYDPCGQTIYGETQDYLIEVIYACGSSTSDDQPSVCGLTEVDQYGFRVFCTNVSNVPKAASFSFYATD